MIGNDSIFGQIATFLEALHLSYKEVFELIPYRNLTLMAKDKLRPVYGKKVNKVRGKDMLARKRKKKQI